MGATFTQMLREQPLIVAGIGLAIGAAIGAALPETETEDRLMGDYSDEMKQRARTMAAEQRDKARNVAEQVYETAKSGAAEIVDTATRAAKEEGLPVGTLRSEHDRERGSERAGEGLKGSMTERPDAAAGKESRDAIPHTGREGFGEGQEEEHSRPGTGPSL